jgi:cell wall-associated NlpC family hydrolase
MAEPLAQRLLERLVGDAEFRALFESDPVGTARAAGFDQLADELASDDGNPMQSLEKRESKSSLAGALMAAAVEGAGLFESLGHHVAAPTTPTAQAAPPSPAAPAAQPVPAAQAAPPTPAPVTPDVGGTESPAARLAARAERVAAERASAAAARPVAHAQGAIDGAAAHVGRVSDPTHTYGTFGHSPYGLTEYSGHTVDNITHAALDAAAKKFGGGLRVIQGSYNAGGVAASGGTHDGGGVVDVAPANGDWEGAVTALRKVGFAAWIRNLPGHGQVGSGAHIHAVLIGNKEMSPAARLQVNSYMHNDNGLAGSAPDDGPRQFVHNRFVWGKEPPSDADVVASHVASAAAAHVDVPFLAPSGAYPGDDAPKSQIVAWMATSAERRGLPRELPVMAALVESGLKNDNYGDRDSLGFFQMRTSIWDQGEYKGFPNRPQLQLRWFLDHAEAVKKQRLAAGLSVKDPRQYGNWIADVERPAEEYRGRYQLRLDEARSLLEHAASRHRASRASTGNDARVLPTVHPDDLGGGSAGTRAAIVKSAKSFVGTPYVWGGETPNGFDCSGFVQYVFHRAGIDLPRVSYQQAEAGRRISLSALKPGDLVAWDNSSRNEGADHIAIYIGDGKIAEAPRTGVDLRIRRLGSNEGDAWGVRILRRKHG